MSKGYVTFPWKQKEITVLVTPPEEWWREPKNWYGVYGLSVHDERIGPVGSARVRVKYSPDEYGFRFKLIKPDLRVIDSDTWKSIFHYFFHEFRRYGG